MKRLLVACWTMACGLALIAWPLQAQQQRFYLGFGGGVSAPISSASDNLNAGPNGVLALTWMPAGSRELGLQLDAMYHSMGGDAQALGGLDVNQQVISATLSGLYRFPGGELVRVHPYVIGGGGLYNFDVTGNDAGDVNAETKFGLQIGAGTDVQVSARFMVFAEARYHRVFFKGTDFQFVPVSIGGRVTFGGE
jgi:opacity protein-like surface antigen